jgi:hypothetical protein
VKDEREREKERWIKRENECFASIITCRFCPLGGPERKQREPLDGWGSVGLGLGFTGVHRVYWGRY